jgi:hypothetical protein
MPPLWKLDRATPSLSVPFAPGRHEVVIVGAGITGLSTGLMLATLGRDVAIVEAGEIAELATGSNTGKVSLLQGSTLSTLRRHHPASLVRAYVDANRAGAEWLTAFARDAGVSTTTPTAYSYAPSRSGLATVEAEIAVGREAGLDIRRAEDSELATPFPTMAAAALDGQLAVDPVALADALARAFVAAGGTLHTGTRCAVCTWFPSPSCGRMRGRSVPSGSCSRRARPSWTAASRSPRPAACGRTASPSPTTVPSRTACSSRSTDRRGRCGP